MVVDDLSDAPEPTPTGTKLVDVMKRVADRQMSMQRTLQNVSDEQHTMRTDIRELRREVGLSMPPHGAAGEAQARRARIFQVRASLRYALVAAAGAGAPLLADWLSKLFGE